MREKQRYDSLDRFRILAAVLVVAIHTSPLASYSADADFFLTRVLGRIAVPFFFMTAGQFIVSGFPEKGAGRAVSYVKKIGLMYAAAALLYIPVGIYAGQYKGLGAAGIFRLLIFDGTFYHLWYFPACITGVLLVYGMSRFLDRRQMLFLAGSLYIIGLFGDSYYGLTEEIPALAAVYEAGFHVFSYTRNGIFMAPVFLLMGAEAQKGRNVDRRILWAGFFVSFLAMTEEAFLLHGFELQRHDSMYIFLLPVMFFLYELLLSAGRASDRKNSSRLVKYYGPVSAWIYILHPAMIVAVRAAAKITKWNLLTANSLVHYLAVLVCSVTAAAAVVFAAEKTGLSARMKRKKRNSRHRGMEEKVRNLHLKRRVKGADKDGSRQEGRSGEESLPYGQCSADLGYAAEEYGQDDGFCRCRAWLELDHKALQCNVSALRSILPQSCKLMPAVKADAYGHGAVLMAEELQKMGVDSFCVACVQEGVKLRRQGIKGEILILGYTHPDLFPLLCTYELTQTIIDYSYAVQLNGYGRDIHVHIGIDTGMHRIGIRSGNFNQIFAIYQMEHLLVDGVFTHFCASDTEKPRDREYTNAQAAAFYQVIRRLEEQGCPCPKIHMQASYGVLNYPELSGDYARIGIALYGVLSTKKDTEKWQQELQPVLSLKARVAAVKNLYRGESAGYGIQFTAGEDMKIATLAIGYADGLPRALSCGVGSVLINGQRAPVIGRICMDQMTVDISGIQDVKAGDTAVLIGRCGSQRILACDVAEQAGTITNEILSRMGARLERVVV